MTCYDLDELQNYFWMLLDAIATLYILATAINTEKKQVLMLYVTSVVKMFTTTTQLIRNANRHIISQ